MEPQIFADLSRLRKKRGKKGIGVNPRNLRLGLSWLDDSVSGRRTFVEFRLTSSERYQGLAMIASKLISRVVDIVAAHGKGLSLACRRGDAAAAYFRGETARHAIEGKALGPDPFRILGFDQGEPFSGLH